LAFSSGKFPPFLPAAHVTPPPPPPPDVMGGGDEARGVQPFSSYRETT